MSSREVTLEGGGPWGFRMHGGADTKQPLRISRVNPGSKAAQQGVREADLISSINGQSTRNASNVDAHAMLKNAGDTLRLGLNKDISGSPKKRIYRSIQEIKTETETIKRSSVSSITVSDSTDSQCSPLDRVLSSVHSDRPTVLNRDTNNLVNEQNNESILRRFDDISSSGVWSPNKSSDSEKRSEKHRTNEPPRTLRVTIKEDERNIPPAPPAPPVWTPRSAGPSPTAERKEFRPVNFESPVLGRRNKPKEEPTTPESSVPVTPPWNQEAAATTITTSLDRRLTTSHSAPTTGLNTLAGTRLPRAQNPTITLLQRAREGQLPRGASYLEENPKVPKDTKPGIISPNEIIYTVKNEYTKEPKTEQDRPQKMADLGPRKFEGIGPTTKDGMPIVLRSEVKENNQAKWYRRMYDTLHRNKNDVHWPPGHYPYQSGNGYLSEPEPNAGGYDSDAAVRYSTLDRRRAPSAGVAMDQSATMPRPSRSHVRNANEVYKNQPGRIEDYIPGHSSIADKEAKEWWDEVMDIFDGHLEQQRHVPSTQSKSYMSHALKESGYESDSQLVFRRRDDTALQLSPPEQRAAYRTLQAGGQPPLQGFRKPAPERPKEPAVAPPPPPKGVPYTGDYSPESPRRYVDSEVTIHYRSPVRQEAKDTVPEDELARRQAEAMRRIYQEERRRKYLQELQDMNSRRHTDNFIPSQKSPISLNRYDDVISDLSYGSLKKRDRSPDPRLVARALFNFQGQSSREISFKKGDIIFVRRQIDRNWYEGEHNAMVGLFPFNYVEIISYDGVRANTTPRSKPTEGQARAKFNFIAQTNLELSLLKGELVHLTRRVDDNWFEGRIANRKGIFPVSYVDVLSDIGDRSQPPPVITSSKPVASPAAHSILSNGSLGGKQSMGAHHYTPSHPVTHHARPASAAPVTNMGQGGYSSLGRSGSKNSVHQTLHVDTHSEAVPYRALYKYRPQNSDELELAEGDTVFVLEKCDDGWFVGSSQRTGCFGTFPGNYVERL